MNRAPSVFKLQEINFHMHQAVEAFNEYFLNLVDSLKVNNVDIYVAISLLRNLYLYNFTEMEVIPVTESEIICAISSLKNTNSSGCEGISNKMLRLCGKFLGKPLAYIFNNLLMQCKFPDCLKYSILNPLLSNYRPVTAYRLL
jgi:hypothetical protein